MDILLALSPAIAMLGVFWWSARRSENRRQRADVELPDEVPDFWAASPRAIDSHKDGRHLAEDRVELDTGDGGGD